MFVKVGEGLDWKVDREQANHEETSEGTSLSTDKALYTGHSW